MAKRKKPKYHFCNQCLFANGSPLYCTASHDKRLISELDKYTVPAWCPLDRRRKVHDYLVNPQCSGVAG